MINDTDYSKMSKINKDIYNLVLGNTALLNIRWSEILQLVNPIINGH